MKSIATAILICCVAGCFVTKTETPQSAAATISDLLSKRDYNTLFRERYSEWYKVEAEGVEPEVAIKRLSTMWEKQHDMLSNAFGQLASSEFTLSKSELPQKTETGDVATATISLNGKDTTYRLYKMHNGLWGFHM